MNIKIKRFHENAVLPVKGSALAACHDLYVTEIIKSENEVLCKFGWGMTPPPGYKINIVPRSSFTKYNWVMNNSPAQMDEDYQGEYMIKFRALLQQSRMGYEDEYQYYDDFPYNIGDRVAQMYLTKVEQFVFEEVDELPDLNSERGDGGFGSTGK